MQALPVLAPIATRPLIRPDFSSTAGLSGKVWVLLNLGDLYDWYCATATEDSDWFEFCAMQFDLQVQIDAENFAAVSL